MTSTPPAVDAWDAFLPDLAVGISTGVSVGIVLLLAQRIDQHRQARSSSLFHWESLKPRLSNAAHMPWTPNLDTLIPGPIALVLLDEYTKDKPLALWRSHFKRPDPAMECVQALLSLRHTLEAAAHEFEASVQFTGIRIAEYHQTELAALSRVLRARAYGVPDEEPLATLVGPYPATYVTNIVDEINEVPRMKSAMGKYRENVRLYDEAILMLRGQLAAS